MIKTAILVVILSWPRMGTLERQYAYPTMGECLMVLEKTRIEIPPNAAENEWIGFATCKYGSPEQGQ